MLSSSTRRLAAGLEVGTWQSSDLRDLMRALYCVPGWLLEHEDALVAQALFLLSRNDLGREAKQGTLLVLAWFLDRDPAGEAAAHWTGNARTLLEREGSRPSDEEVRMLATALRPGREERALSAEAFASAKPAEQVEDILLRHLGVARECLIFGADVLTDFGLTEAAHAALLDEIERALEIRIEPARRGRLRLVGDLYDLHRLPPASRPHEPIARSHEGEARGLPTTRPDGFAGGEQVEVRRDADGVLVFRFHGVLDAQVPFQGVTDAIGEYALDRVLVDLRGVEFGAAAFKGLLVRLYAKTLEAGGRIVFLAPPPPLRAELERSGLTDHFDLQESEASARARIGP